MFGLIPKEESFFELFKNAAHNMIEGSRLLKDMMEHYQSATDQAKRIKEVEHVGDGITHDIALRLNQTFITPIDREDIHDLASALDDILDVAEAIADRFVLYKITKPTARAVKLAEAPALRIIWPPLPGLSSMLCTMEPTGMWRSCMALPDLIGESAPERTSSPACMPLVARM